MICGALQTLNEEACEDVLEETEETKITIDPELPQTSVIPASPSPEFSQGESLLQSVYKKPAIKKVTYEDTVEAGSSRTYPTIFICDGDSS